MSDDGCAAFAPGRVNLIGEHTDYNEGLALPFAIVKGVTVAAEAVDCPAPARIWAYASDLRERDEFPVGDPPPASSWRAFVRGVVAELDRAGLSLGSARVQISGDLPRGCGLSSSAAVSVALCLALIELGNRSTRSGGFRPERMEIARMCVRVENDWVGTRSGLLDEIACLFGVRGAALRIDFRSSTVQQVPLRLGDWRLVVLDSGDRHANASSGYNERRSECVQACELLGVSSLRDATSERASELPEPLCRRVRHVLDENERVMAATDALRAGNLPRLGELLNASHASLRDLYEVSTPAVEQTVRRLRAMGAAGARLVGGGFGGGVLALLPPEIAAPANAFEVNPGPGARVLGRVQRD